MKRNCWVRVLWLCFLGHVGIHLRKTSWGGITSSLLPRRFQPDRINKGKLGGVQPPQQPKNHGLKWDHVPQFSIEPTNPNPKSSFNNNPPTNHQKKQTEHRTTTKSSSPQNSLLLSVLSFFMVFFFTAFAARFPFPAGRFTAATIRGFPGRSHHPKSERRRTPPRPFTAATL